MTEQTSNQAPQARQMKAVHASRRGVSALQDDAAWRVFLQTTVGKDSLRAMNGRELGRVLDELHRRGAPRGRRSQKAGAGNDGMARKVRALWLSLYALGEVVEPTDSAIAAFVHRQAGVEALHWCTPAQYVQVIEALRAWCARAGYAVPEGSAADRCNEILIDAQWQKLIALGVMRTGANARLDSWLRWNYGVAHQCHLDAARQLDAVGKLGQWIRRVKAKKEPTP